MYSYTNTSAESIATGTDAAIARAQQILDEAVASKEARTFENTLLPIDRIGDLMSHAFAEHAFMGFVHPDAEVRAAGNQAQEKLNTFGVDMIFRDDLNQAVKEYAETDEAKGLEGERARFLEFLLRDLRLAGHDLDPETRASVKEKTQRLVELGVRFQNNIDEYSDHILATRDDLEGLPPSFADSLEVDEESGKLKVTLDYPHILPFTENGKRRDLREELSRKFNNQAVESNRPILEEAIRLRDQIAQAFGLASWSHYRLEERMAKNPEAVSDFYKDLLPPLTDQGTSDISAMSRLLKEETGDDTLQVWDWRYYDTQQRRADYGIDPFEVAAYFPLNQVLDGLFDLVEETFGIKMEEHDPNGAWHPDVRLFAMLDVDTAEELARFYLDLFPREGKFGHAAEFPLILSRRLEDGSYQNPMCAMVTNFTKPTATAPSLLQHSEVETFFHEFGHVLHQSLGRTEVARFAGTNVEQDFVEAPSQIMQHWVWRADVLKRFAKHHETGEPIPGQLVDKLVEARQLNIAVHQLRQLQFGWLDQQIHAPGTTKDLEQILRDAAEISLLPFPEGTFSMASFGHLMGGYDSAYYGYMWAEVFGDDMFSLFEEKGATDPEVGRAYRREILEKGGSIDAADMLVNFLGREPSNSAFLSKLGIG
ncbi:MAG: Zn-dependent oligopeptidase [Acidimicrobiia bacterium]|nr:Zn-dependent oligopeptidase [Acidimicrobiia bacterium]